VIGSSPEYGDEIATTTELRHEGLQGILRLRAFQEYEEIAKAKNEQLSLVRLTRIIKRSAWIN